MGSRAKYRREGSLSVDTYHTPSPVPEEPWLEDRDGIAEQSSQAETLNGWWCQKHALLKSMRVCTSTEHVPQLAVKNGSHTYSAQHGANTHAQSHCHFLLGLCPALLIVSCVVWYGVVWYDVVWWCF